MVHGSGPHINAIKRAIRESTDEVKANKQRCFHGIMCAADAWQILVRAEESDMAKDLDDICKVAFETHWAAVSAEVFMSNRPERVQSPDNGDDNGQDAGPSTPGVEFAGPAGQIHPPMEAGPLLRASCRIAQAWDFVDEVSDVDDKSGPESLMSWGIANFGEKRFRNFMRAARRMRREESK